MKPMYVVALSIFILGLALLVYSNASGTEVNLFGLSVHSRITKGIGVITMIFSVITFLAVRGGIGDSLSQGKPRS